jgi:hypothetical protein
MWMQLPPPTGRSEKTAKKRNDRVAGKYFERAYKPWELTSFDATFDHEFSVPVDATSEAIEEMSSPTATANRHVSKSVCGNMSAMMDYNNDEYENVEYIDQSKILEKDPNDAMLPDDLPRSFSSISALVSKNSIDMPRYPVSDLRVESHLLETSSAEDEFDAAMEHGVDPDDVQAHLNAGRGGFQFGRYVREFGAKAKTIVG